MKFNSLFSRIAPIFTAFMIVFGGVSAALNLIAAKHYQQETIQRLSERLAGHIATHWPVTKDGKVDQQAANELFHMLMIVNPSIELYLLDAEGNIIASDAPANTVIKQRVSIKPISEFLSGGKLPIKGDNPRHPDQAEVFSATSFVKDGKTVGYLYIVLAGDAYQALNKNSLQGHVLQNVILIGTAALFLTIIVGIGVFFMVTRRLNILTNSVTKISNNLYEGELQLDQNFLSSTDEIGQLAVAFSKMVDANKTHMQHIHSQDELRREMVANVSHDLRTPLTSMQGYLETMQRKFEQLSAAEHKAYLDIAVRQSQRVSHLAAELFELAKLECEVVQPYFEQFLIQDLIQDIVQKFELSATERKVGIKVNIVDNIPFVFADIAMIERVLTNLLDNALRYTSTNGQIELTLKLDENNRVMVRVSDNGSGIADEYIPSLFERDSPLRLLPKKHQGGGLGLLITKRILQLHGSAIEVLSGKGRGAIFTFKLPTTLPV